MSEVLWAAPTISAIYDLPLFVGPPPDEYQKMVTNDDDGWSWCIVKFEIPGRGGGFDSFLCTRSVPHIEQPDVHVAETSDGIFLVWRE